MQNYAIIYALCLWKWYINLWFWPYMYFLFTHIFLILHRGLLQIWWYSSYYECRILALSSFIPALLNICLLTALILFTGLPVIRYWRGHQWLPVLSPCLFSIPYAKFVSAMLRVAFAFSIYFLISVSYTHLTLPTTERV